MIDIDTRAIVRRLTTLESVAVIPRVASTNLIARRIVGECIENELSLPRAIILAGEQFAGRGRNDRRWSSPAGKGIYATTLLARSAKELPLVPLDMAVIVATFLRETFAIDARIKWPNDVLAVPRNGEPRKIAGILIEARLQDDRAYMLIGTGVNVEPVVDDTRPNAISITELTDRHVTLSDATVAFIEHVDQRLALPLDRERVLSEWRALAIHKPGDRIHCILGDRTIDGTWNGIDEHGRALIRSGDETTAVSAGDIVLA
ncbi:MAG TPA: biotin--[acetyl-CoA-carboxylase] ligase [Thermoanaerobaculia bacterium]|jgi:BirA family biotin operon repressor/biotin-[acetyl-CoA-carboxylase] ligase